jgi:hypothetical protein
MIEDLQSWEWLAWGYVVAIFGLSVLIMVAVIQYVRGIGPDVRGIGPEGKHWSLALAALYGLILSFLLLGAQALTTGIGNPQGLGNAGIMTYWATRLGLLPLVFVIIAAIRNNRVTKGNEL